MKDSKVNIDGIDAKIQYAVKEDANIPKEQIREWLVKDIRGTYILLSEVLNSKEVIDAILEVMWKRYQALHEKVQQQPELDLKPGE